MVLWVSQVAIFKKESTIEKKDTKWAVVVTQLAAWPLPMPEDPGSNPVINYFF